MKQSNDIQNTESNQYGNNLHDLSNQCISKNLLEENNEAETETASDIPVNMKPGAVKLRSWLNKTFRVKMTDGRTLIGVFFCTDRDSNIILGSCLEYLPNSSAEQEASKDEPRMLGLVMIPGRHIVQIEMEINESYGTLSMISDQDDFV